MNKSLAVGLTISLALLTSCIPMQQQTKAPMETEFVPETLSTANRRSLSMLEFDCTGLGTEALFVKVDGVFVGPRDESILRVYVSPGQHQVIYEWVHTVEDRRYFGQANDVGGVLTRQTQGYVVSGFHNVTDLEQKDILTVAAGERRQLVPNPVHARPPDAPSQVNGTAQTVSTPEEKLPPDFQKKLDEEAKQAEEDMKKLFPK